MTVLTQDDTRRHKQDEWIVQLDPSLARFFKEGASTAAKPGGSAPGGAAAAGHDQISGDASLKIAADAELLTKEIKKDTKYGELKISISIKTTESIKTGDGPVEVAVTGTSKDTSKGRTLGTKKGVSYKDIDDREIFGGISLEKISVGGEAEISGSDFSVSATVSGDITTKAFSAPAQVKLILVKIKGAKDIQILGGEFKIEPHPFKFTIGGVETKLRAEFKAAFAVDMKKIGIMIAEKKLKEYAIKQLEKAAAEQGVKFLGREAAELVLRDLGPLAAAFSVGWDIGELLNAYTIAPEVAQAVDEEILGDLNERYQSASTLGKIMLIHDNLPNIAAALVASGLAGAVAGISDLIACKLLHLDKLGQNFKTAYAAFQGLLRLIPDIGAGMADMVTGTALTLGIKYNPAHHAISDRNLAAIAAAVHAELKPLYRKNGGLQSIVDFQLQDADIPATALEGAAAMILKSGKGYGDMIKMTDQDAARDSLMELGAQSFIGFMETNKHIAYKVALGKELGVNAIPADLLAELFA